MSSLKMRRLFKKDGEDVIKFTHYYSTQDEWYHMWNRVYRNKGGGATG